MSFDILSNNAILESFGVKTRKLKIKNPGTNLQNSLRNPFNVGPPGPGQTRRVKNPIRRTIYRVVSVKGSRDFTSITQARAWARKQVRATRQRVNIFRSN